jgi:hypothetical protein
VVAFNFIIDFSFNNRSAAAAETYVMELSDKVQANLVDDLFCEAENARVQHRLFTLLSIQAHTNIISVTSSVYVVIFHI